MSDIDWSRMSAAVGRLAERLDDNGKADLSIVLDMVEKLRPTRVDDDPNFPRHEFVGPRRWEGTKCKVCDERWPHPIHNVANPPRTGTAGRPSHADAETRLAEKGGSVSPSVRPTKHYPWAN